MTPLRSFTPTPISRAFTPSQHPPMTRFRPISSPCDIRSHYRAKTVSPSMGMPYIDTTPIDFSSYRRRSLIPSLRYDPSLDPLWETEYSAQKYRPQFTPRKVFDIERYSINKFKSILDKPRSMQQVSPYLTTKLTDTRIELSQPAQLKCHAIGGKASKIRWYKNGMEIKDDGRLSLWNASNSSFLDISRTCLKDSGLYRAVVENDLGTTSYYCLLTVTRKTTSYMYKELPFGADMNYTFKEGEIIRVISRMPERINEELILYHNGIRRASHGRVTVHHDRSGFLKMIIFNATIGDSGHYKFTTRTGTTIKAFYIKVVPTQLQLDMEREKSVDRYGSMVKNDLRVDATLYVPQERGTFKRDTRSVERTSTRFGGTILIPFARSDCYDDCAVVSTTTAIKSRSSSPFLSSALSSSYTSLDKFGTTTNRYGMSSTAAISSSLHGLRKSSTSAMDSAPYFLKHLRDVRCHTNEEVQLNCMVEGIPTPMLSWEKDGRQITSGHKYTIKYKEKYCSLIIHSTQLEDSGEYFCIANNSMGRVRTSARVSVLDKENSRYVLSRYRTPSLNLTSIRSTTPIHSSNHMSFTPPKFYSVPHNRVVEEGSTAFFQSVVAGEPSPWSTWDKDGIIMTPNARIIIKDKNDIRTLEIQNVTMNDAGLYRITIENDYGRNESTFRLDVISTKPGKHNEINVRKTTSAYSSRGFRYTRRIMASPVSHGGRLVFRSLYSSHSEPSAKFYHNGKLLEESDRIGFRIEPKCITLEIKNPKPQDAGEYILESIVGDETHCTSTFVPNDFLTQKPSSKLGFVKSLPPKMEIYEGTCFDLKLEIDSETPYEYQWYRNDTLIPDSCDFKYIDFQNGFIGLRVKDVFTQDSGKIRCLLTNGIETSETETVLKVLESEFTEKVQFLQVPKPVICNFGDVASFYASVSPASSRIRWFVQGKEVTATSDEFMLEDGESDGTRTLHILGAEYHHSGDISCQLSNESHPNISLETTFTHLAVLPIATEPRNDASESSPCFTRGPIDATALSGSTVTLEAFFRGTPEPNIKWMRGGHPITDSNARIIHTYGYTKLLIRNITTDQSGKYTIEITNQLGTDIMSTSLGIETQPDPPSSAPSVALGQDRLAVAWCGSPYDGGCMVTEYILEIQKDDDEWTELAVVRDSLAYTAKDLDPKHKYRFRVRAVNIHGPSQPSEESAQVVMEQSQDEPEYHETETVTVADGGCFKDRFETLEEMGKGRFGHVHKVVEKSTGQILAAKFVKCIKVKDKEKVMDEIRIMKALNHPKLLQLATYFECPREIIMVTECITGGELFERVVADDFTLTEWDCIQFMRQICEGVEYMHNKFIVHLDLKPENIMCYTKNSHQIKIIDFGLAQQLQENVPMRVLFGTPEFIPPEIINYEPISPLSDMWSVGVICYVLLSGLSPFMGDSDSDTFSNILRADFDFNDEAFDEVSQDAKEFISSCLIRNKEERASASDCLRSKWLSKNECEEGPKVKISTDKLKKFIVRRKWQKTGNAIRALGRMVTLSASRRNSGITSNGPSNTNSPRPSIAIHHLPSLDENRETKVQFDTDTMDSISVPLKNKNLKVNNCERSDSGFSEVEENSFEDKSAKSENNEKILQPELLIQKLEEIAEIQQIEEKKIRIPGLIHTGVVKERTRKLSEKFEKSMSPVPEVTKSSTKKDIPEKIEKLRKISAKTEIPPKKDIPQEVQKKSEGIKRYSPPKMVIQPNSKTALLRQKFENNCKANEQPHVRHFRTK